MENKIRTETIEYGDETFKVKFEVFKEDSEEPFISIYAINDLGIIWLDEEFVKDIESACMKFLTNEHLSKLDEYADQKYSAAKEDW